MNWEYLHYLYGDMHNSIVHNVRPVRIGVAGPAGANTTLVALTMAKQLSSSDESKRIIHIDLNNGLAGLCSVGDPNIRYEAVGDYETLFNRLESLGSEPCSALVITRFDKTWKGPGGIMAWANEQIESHVMSRDKAWRLANEQRGALFARLQSVPCLVIATVLANFESVPNSSGKETTKLVLASHEHDREEFEFFLDVDPCMSLMLNGPSMVQPVFCYTGLTDRPEPVIPSEILFPIEVAQNQCPLKSVEPIAA